MARLLLLVRRGHAAESRSVAADVGAGVIGPVRRGVIGPVRRGVDGPVRRGVLGRDARVEHGTGARPKARAVLRALLHPTAGVGLTRAELKRLAGQGLLCGRLRRARPHHRQQGKKPPTLQHSVAQFVEMQVT